MNVKTVNLENMTQCLLELAHPSFVRADSHGNRKFKVINPMELHLVLKRKSQKGCNKSYPAYVTALGRFPVIPYEKDEQVLAV